MRTDVNSMYSAGRTFFSLRTSILTNLREETSDENDTTTAETISLGLPMPRVAPTFICAATLVVLRRAAKGCGKLLVASLLVCSLFPEFFLQNFVYERDRKIPSPTTRDHGGAGNLNRDCREICKVVQFWAVYHFVCHDWREAPLGTVRRGFGAKTNPADLAGRRG
jgi:hypothetical protein